jgi:hypothetical protein
MPVASRQGFKEVFMSDQHLRRLCWGMCSFCALVLAGCLVYLVSHEHKPAIAGTMALAGLFACIGFLAFFSIAHDEQSQ